MIVCDPTPSSCKVVYRRGFIGLSPEGRTEHVRCQSVTLDSKVYVLRDIF